MWKITIFILWITCTLVIQKYGMGFQAVMQWSWRMPCENTFPSCSKSNQICCMNWQVSISLDFIYSVLLSFRKITCTQHSIRCGLDCDTHYHVCHRILYMYVNYYAWHLIWNPNFGCQSSLKFSHCNFYPLFSGARLILIYSLCNW